LRCEGCGNLRGCAYARNNPLICVDPARRLTRHASAPGGFACGEILVINAKDHLCSKGGGATMPSTGAGFGVRPSQATSEPVGPIAGSRRARSERNDENFALTISFSGGFELVNLEVGVIVVVDTDAGTATEYAYVAGGPGVSVSGLGAITGTMNVEAGGIDKGADLSGVGWQLNAVVAVALKGMTANATGTFGWGLGPGWDVLAVSAGYAGGLGASVSGMVTYTKLTNVYDLRALPPYLKGRLPARP